MTRRACACSCSCSCTPAPEPPLAFTHSCRAHAPTTRVYAVCCFLHLPPFPPPLPLRTPPPSLLSFLVTPRRNRRVHIRQSRPLSRDCKLAPRQLRPGVRREREWRCRHDQQAAGACQQQGRWATVSSVRRRPRADAHGAECQAHGGWCEERARVGDECAGDRHASRKGASAAGRAYLGDSPWAQWPGGRPGVG